MAAQTLNDIFLKTISTPRPAAMKYKKDGQWLDITVPEFERTVRDFSAGLRSLGVKPGDRVAILSENRPEWSLSDFAILAARAVSVPIYPTLVPHQIEYILRDSGSVAVVCSTWEQAEKILAIRDHCPALINVIICDDEGKKLPERTFTFKDIQKRGVEFEKESVTKFDDLLRSATPNDLATLVYTSGTTGEPKGAMLTHGNIASNVAATNDLMPFRPGDIALSILPLSHILERMADFTYFYNGGCVAYAENVMKVRDNLQEVKPTVFAAVPRLFEKMKMAIMENVDGMPAARQKLFHWALDVASERLPYMVDKKKHMPPMLAFKSALASKLVFHKISDRLGGRLRFVLSGGAPLSKELAEFFVGAGIEIFEGYGLTETSPVIAINTFEHRRLGTVGHIIPGVEVKIAEDGEIITRGPHIMKGYFNNPEATAHAIDSDGWFHTGDIGHIDSDGFLKITDRKKEIIINAYGKNIAPQPLEGLLKTSPSIGTPVLIGDRRKFLSALIVPNFEKLERDAKQLGLNFSDRAQLVNDPQVKAIMQKEIDRFNASLDRQEHVRKFTLLPTDFTLEEGEITPSLKVKRKVIDQKYKSLIDAMYVDEDRMAG
jgi:long-chain acyl-CoA synthetase